MQLPAWRLGAGCPVTRGAERVQRSGKTNLSAAGEGRVDQGDLDRSEVDHTEWQLASRVHTTIAR